jgi:DNA-binding Xre family transcriptional regulator
MSKNQTEQLARELAREAGFLSERWRAWLLEQLREDFKAADLEQHRIDQLNQPMSEAAAALQRAAKHLKLRKTEDQLRLTMREFDAAPAEVREDWQGRQVAEAVRGSWQLAKAVAFTDERLPVAAERKWERAKGLARKRRETAFALSGIENWLATSPDRKSGSSYDRWSRQHNQQERQGQKPLPSSFAIHRRYGMPWPEIVAAVEAGGLREAASPDGAGEDQAKRPGRRRKSKNYVLDAELRARRIREGREAKGLNSKQLAEQIGVDPSHLRRIESGKVKQTTFENIIKLAIALDLSLDDFATPD